MGKIVHTELNTSDPAAACKFYKGLFGWKLEDMPMPGGTYTMVRTKEGEGIGGIQQHPMPDSPSTWLSYVDVKNVKRAVARAVKLGGTVLQPATDIGMGILAVLRDPTGADIAIWQSKPQKPAAKKATAKKKTAKKATAKKKTAKKAAKKATAKKATAKKATAKKATAKKAGKKPAKKKAGKKKASKKKASKKKSA